MVNALTIDVEDYFQVNAFARHVKSEDWDYFSLRVPDNTRKILDMLDEYSLKGTFFVLGWVAERVPRLIREIYERGHEIASHGYGHRLIYLLGPKKFREDVRKSRQILEDITGTDIAGYRAPTYSITVKSLWALDILIEEGFRYDSSIFPILHDTYGIPDACRFPHMIKRAEGIIHEFPLTTLSFKLAGREFRIPIAGGGYLRFFPVELFRKAIENFNTHENQPAVLYFHPWEIDPRQPRIRAGMKARFRHYLNLNGTEGKLRTLFSSVQFSTMGEVLRLLTLAEPVKGAENIPALVNAQKVNAPCR